MGWCSLSQKLISRSADLARLRSEGYNIEIRSGFLLVKEVPYLNPAKAVQRGMFVVKLVLAGDVTAKPETHALHFVGEYPCHADGTRIDQIFNSSETKQLAEGVTI